MGWSVPPTKRSYVCRGKYLQFLREQRGWTQEDFAAKAGYSPRLIRKAESGGGISPATIEDLAETLSRPEDPTFPEDLISDPVAAAKLMFASYDQYEREMLPYCSHLMAEDIVFWCAGDPTEMPFAGSYHGLAGVQAFLDDFFGVFTRPAPRPFCPALSLAGNEVVARYREDTEMNGVIGPPIWIVNISKFQRGKIIRIENYFDTDTGQRRYFDSKRTK